MRGSRSYLHRAKKSWRRLVHSSSHDVTGPDRPPLLLLGATTMMCVAGGLLSRLASRRNRIATSRIEFRGCPPPPWRLKPARLSPATPCSNPRPPLTLAVAVRHPQSSSASRGRCIVHLSAWIAYHLWIVRL